MGSLLFFKFYNYSYICIFVFLMIKNCVFLVDEIVVWDVVEYEYFVCMLFVEGWMM